MRVVVIGGGPAGMMAAITSAKNNNEVYLLEKNNDLGQKLLITGKGRCNLTSSLDISEFIKNIPGNGNFLYSAFRHYTNEDIIRLMEENGVKTKQERGNRVFPCSDKSIDVLSVFKKELSKYKVNIYCNSTVKEILVENNSVVGVKYSDNKVLDADKVILATGGETYRATGSTGDGYKIAKELGHTVTEIRPSLVPLTVEEDSLELCKMLQGLSLKNVKIILMDNKNNKKIYDDFGEMLFTHFGVSGPIILSSSAHLIRYKDIDSLLKNGNIALIIDLKPALSNEKLDLRLQREFEKEKNKDIKNVLVEVLPHAMIKPMLKVCKIEEEKKVNSITKEERKRLVKNFKEFELTISGFRPLDEGIITSGGIDVKEINPKNMESKIIKGLYFAGEVIDVDAYTGGFNLQIAYSTGFVAGLNGIS